MKFCTLGIIVVLLCSLPLQSSSEKDQKKALEAKAKALIEEGKTIEKQNRLLDARAKYAEAQGIIETRDGAKASYEVDREISKRTKKSLEEAKQAYNSGKYSDAQTALSQASDLEPGNASVSYNQALCYLKLNDRAKAVDSLNNAIHSASDEKEKERLTEFRDSLLTDEKSGNLENVQKERVKQVNALSLSLKNSSWRDTFTATDDPPLPNDASPDPPEVATNGHVDAKAADPAPAPRTKLAPTEAREDPRTTLCRKLSDLKDILPQSPAIYFNLARCAELDGRTEESIQLFNKYLLIAPNALDTKDVQLRVEDLTALTGVSDKKGPDLRKLYADAARNLDLGRYERALQDYLKADSLIPNFPQTKRRLGLMYEMFGNIEKARDYFVAYKNLSQTTTDKADADAHLNGLNQKKEQYETSIKKADDILAELLDRWVGIDSAGNHDNNKLKGSQGRVTSNRTRAGAQSLRNMLNTNLNLHLRNFKSHSQPSPSHLKEMSSRASLYCLARTAKRRNVISTL
jgi:tetratricopeptide (TPR) repeat protein